MIDPIRIFSRYQAAYFQKSTLEMKIYALTASALLGVVNYFLSSLIPRREIAAGQNSLILGAVAWLFLSTVGGYCLDRQKKPPTA